MGNYLAVQIGWGVIYGSRAVAPGLGWLRTGKVEIHGIREYMSRLEAETEILKDAAAHPERIGTYEVRPTFEGFCGNPTPCALCREHLEKFED